MKYLLDSHVILWLSGDSGKISKNAMEEITNIENDLLVSIASLWEIAIKINLGKLDINISLAQLFNEIQNCGFEIIPIKPDHILRLHDLPYFHKDPFDRLLHSNSILRKSDNFIRR